jgi:hypothetical protein
MKTLKNIFATRRFCALVLALIMSISMFGSTTVFASETDTSITPHVTVLMHGSTHDYVTGSQTLGRFELKKSSTYPSTEQKMLTISYSYEDESHFHKANLVFKGSAGYETVVPLGENLTGKATVSLRYNQTYTVTVDTEPGCNSRYMISVNVYY